MFSRVKPLRTRRTVKTSEGLSIGSLISVDPNVLSSAFNFNPQALNFSSINLSGLDMSSLDLSDVQLPAFDPSQLNLSDSNVLSSVTSSLDPAALAAASQSSLQQTFSRFFLALPSTLTRRTSCYFFAYGQHCSGMELLECC